MIFIDKIYEKLKFNNINIEFFDTLPSTNSYLKTRAKIEDEGLVIIADNQTSGRGRFDRKFFSPKDSGIYMSILLKPNFKGFDATLITTAAATAVAVAVEKLSGKKCEIKWVNDVLIDGKKICGILTEGNINPKNGFVEYVVLGIGLNVFMPKNGFNAEIRDIAGFVFDYNNTNLKSQLTIEILNVFFEYYNNFQNKIFLNEYKSRSAVIGKNIIVLKNKNEIPASAILIDDFCRLKVKYSDGSTEFLTSGEISIKL